MHPHTLNFILLIALSFGIFHSCGEFLTDAAPDNEVLDGPLTGLSPTQMQIFLNGDEAFGEVFTPETGLGPYFVTSSCASCHRGDGKGHISTTLTRFGKWENGIFDPLVSKGGGQLQHRAIPGFIPETIPAEANGIARFTPPAVTGLGFLAAIPDATLLDWSDPDDLDGDGISGRVNYVDPPEFFEPLEWHIPDDQNRYIGRFGKKASVINLLQQTVGAYKQDMGITSDFDLNDPVNPLVATQQIDPIDDPEISAATVNNVVFYLQTLKAPLPRNTDDGRMGIGKAIFTQIGCASCHRPTVHTGLGEIALLSDKTIHPYTDLLLHDMGSDLDDNYTEGMAKTYEWRTPPLWGLGLSIDAQGGQYFLLHDGRARSIEEAILLHGGEGSTSRNNYQALSETEKEAIIFFLESL